MFCCLKRLFMLGLICCAFVFLIQLWLKSKTYIFSENVISRIAEKHAVKGKPINPEAVYKKVYDELKLKYRGHVLPENDLEWLFINAGGWMGSMCVLHASITEYVLFFGTALDTSGHSGRYWANVTDTILSGEFLQWQEGQLKIKIHKPGDTVKHVSGEAAAVHFKADTWAVEYGRGFIPSTLGFALADSIFSTQDFMAIFYLLRVYIKAVALEVGYYVGHPEELFAI